MPKPKSLDFAELVSLLNSSRSVSIDSTPVTGRDGRWGLYSGTYKVHTTTVPFEVLYIGSDATHGNMDDARGHFKKGQTQVVYASSLDRGRRKYHVELFGDPADKLWSVKGYIQSFIRDELDSYVGKLQALAPKDYIDPQVTTPAGTKGKIPNPILAALQAPKFEEDSAEGLVVLLGEPGQGKTYMSRHLVSQLATAKTLLPIYINSEQWSTMPRAHLGSLEKTITHSFRHFEAPIAWVEGQEDRFLSATLKADLFRIIFDGFDEYILRNAGTVQVREVLDQLTSLSSATGARILITSRTSFWETNVDEAEFVSSSRAAVYRICPFDAAHARNYFAKRFDKNRARVDSALNVYTTLSSGQADLIGRGFVLKLVGDLAAQTEQSPEVSSQGAAIRRLMIAFCAREEVRQALPISPDEQMLALQTFAEETETGAPPTTEILDLCLQDVAPRLGAVDRADCLLRMEPHPLLHKEPASNNWVWSQEQVGNIMLAEWLRSAALAGDAGGGRLRRLLQRQRLSAARMNDVSAMIVDLSAEESSSERTQASVREIVRQVLAAARSERDASGMQDGRALATLIALKSVNRFCPPGSPRKDRTAVLLRLLNGPPVQDLAVTGTISSFDLRGIVFVNCRFERVMWANVDMDSATLFEGCHFVGGLAERTTGLGLADFRDCTRDSDADELIVSAQIREGKRRYAKDDLKSDLKKVLAKFVGPSGFLQTVESRNLKKGAIRGSRFCDEIVDAIEGRILERHHLSGTTEGGLNVKSESAEAVRFLATNGVLTGPLTELFDGLCRKLHLDG